MCVTRGANVRAVGASPASPGCGACPRRKQLHGLGLRTGGAGLAVHGLEEMSDHAVQACSLVPVSISWISKGCPGDFNHGSRPLGWLASSWVLRSLPLFHFNPRDRLPRFPPETFDVVFIDGLLEARETRWERLPTNLRKQCLKFAAGRLHVRRTLVCDIYSLQYSNSFFGHVC